VVIAAVIPARDEEATIGRAVAALRAEGVRHVLVLANDCRDATVARARAAGATVHETGPLAGGVGAARRAGCDLALRLWPAGRILLTTDADGYLAPGSVAVVERSLRAADAVMGRIRPEPAEHDALPQPLRTLGDLESRRDALLAELGAICAPQAHDPQPRHLCTNGALMAFRREAYLAVGGFAAMCSNEDKDIGARLSRLGFRIARPRDAVVTVSCRRTGRAPGGMAACIADRLAADLDPQIERSAAQCRRLERLVVAARREGRSAMNAMTRLLPDPANRLTLPALPVPAAGWPEADRPGTE